MSKKPTLEHRKSERFNPEPEDAEKALFFKNNITVKFPCDSVEREVTDLSETGLKVFLDEDDPLTELLGKKIKALLTLGDESINIRLTLIHVTEDDFGLSYMGCRFDQIKEKELKAIKKFLEESQK